jgi:hypothetical protein
MGRDFRDGRYKRYVRLGKRTVKDGEAAVIWNMNGVSREVVGPRLVRLFYSNVNFLTRHVATRDQYLKVSHRNGDTEHLQGPRAMFENPVKHSKIEVVNNVYLESANHKLVVYTENKRVQAVTAQGDGIEFVETGGNDGIKQSIIMGPTKFMPQVNQMLHTFNWDRKFHVLDTSEQQWTQEIDILSTDNIKATATLVFSLTFASIEKLLLSKDPFLELRNALNADLSQYGSNLTWSEMEKTFRDDVRKMGNLANFYARADAIGVDVRNVLLKNVVGDKKLLSKIQAKLDAETKFEQERRQEESRQNMESMAIEQRQKMARSKLEAQNQLVESQQLLARKEKEHALEIQKQEDDAKALERERRNKETIEFLKEMKSMGVNLDTFLTANTQTKKSIVMGAPALGALQDQISPSDQTIHIIK